MLALPKEAVDAKKLKTALIAANAFTAFEYIFFFVICLTFYGSDYLQRQDLPIVDLIRYVQLPFAERLEMILIPAYAISVVYVVAILLLYAAGAIQCLARSRLSAGRAPLWLAFLRHASADMDGRSLDMAARMESQGVDHLAFMAGCQHRIPFCLLASSSWDGSRFAGHGGIDMPAARHKPLLLLLALLVLGGCSFVDKSNTIEEISPVVLLYLDEGNDSAKSVKLVSPIDAPAEEREKERDYNDRPIR